jgi:hypothetical protein
MADVKKTALRAFFIILFCTVCAACSSGATKIGKSMAAGNCNVFTVDVEPGLTVVQVKQSILLSLADRQWNVVCERDNVFVAELNRLNDRNIYGRISINYTKDRICITDLSIDKNGRPFVALRWICYLQHSLVRHMSEMASMS